MDATWRRVHPLEQLLLEPYYPNKPEIITIVLTLSQSLGLEELEQHFIPRLLSHPRFSSTVTRTRLGTYRYDPVKDFSSTATAFIQQHVKVESTASSTESEVVQLSKFLSRLSEISSTPLDPARPLWVLHVFPCWSLVPSERSSSTTLVLRVHHSVSDGLGLVKYFLSQVTDENESAFPSATARPATKVSSRSFGRFLVQSASDVYRVILKPFLRDPVCILTRAPVGEANYVSMLTPRAFSVPEVKLATTQLGITINDLLFSAYVGAIRKYVTEHGDDPVALKGMRVAMPYSRRTFEGFDMLDSDVSNQLAMIPVPFAVEEPDRLNRLRACTEEMLRVKSSIQPWLVTQAMRAITSLPSKVRRIVWARVASSATTLFSNVAGPTRSVSIGGARVSAIFFSPPCGVHNSVNIGILSYDGGFFVSVAGDAARLAHPQHLLDYFHEEVLAIVELSKAQEARALFQSTKLSGVKES